MQTRSNVAIICLAIATLLAPLLVAASAVPEAGKTFAVLLPPWMDETSQVALLSGTGVALRDNGSLAGIGPSFWLVTVPDPQSAGRLARAPALLLAGSLVGCGT